MKLFQKYLTHEIYVAITIVLGGFLSLFIFFDMLQEIGDIKDNYTFIIAFGYVLLNSLGRVYELLPIAVLIGALYTLSRFAARSEFTVMRVSGLSTKQAITMVLKIGLPIVIVTFLFGELIAPMAYETARQIKSEAVQRLVRQTNRLRTGFWAHDRNYIVNVGGALQNDRVEDILIYELNDGFTLKSIQFAKEGQFIPQEGWHLKDVHTSSFTDTKQVIATTQKESIWVSDLDVSTLRLSTTHTDRISLPDLLDYSQRLMRNKEKADQYLLALWKKMIYPLACLVMMVIALPIAYQQHRSQRTSLSLFLGILLGVAFYMLNALISSLGLLNNWPIPLIAMLPSLIFLAIGSALLWQVQRQ